jgi:hypothetical protein
VRRQLDADVAAAQLGTVGGAGSAGLLLRLKVDEGNALRLALLVQRDLDATESEINKQHQAETKSEQSIE